MAGIEREGGTTCRPLTLTTTERKYSWVGKRHVLRVECSRCSRIVEIQEADAARFYGASALWKDVGQRLLDQTCTNRTGRHEEDGCWPDWSS
jgi:hypothetical protein